MSNYDKLYRSMVTDIIVNGDWDNENGAEVRTRYVSDGAAAPSKSLVSTSVVFNDTTSTHEVPILTTKHVAWKTAIKELLWLYVHRTSDATFLKQNNVKIWDEWIRNDNTIGRAYGYQLGKLIRTGKREYHPISGHLIEEFTNQVHQLINGIKSSPYSRRHVVSLWNIDDLHDMSLPPCVWNFQVVIRKGKLNMIVQIRSNDIALGQPFNFFQYYVLQRMLAQVTGYDIGSLRFNINNPHIYDRHVDALIEQVNRKGFKAPELWINPAVKNFDDFTVDDFKLLNYEHHEKIHFEVAE